MYREIDTCPAYSTSPNADINECKTGANACHEGAECSNTDGGYECECRDGFTGNGTHCDGMALIMI